ncbi:cell division protein FtsK [Bacillus cereus]|uniref:cell division protein FtsK n=1 Tax=Bacillus cereus TaxID=1396 RepID=UPI000C290D41|nr:cell division protein FtsK [Bacillus cereus]
MKFHKKIIDFLNKLKNIWKADDEGISDYEKKLIDRIPTQNPYGLIGMFMGGIAFIFGRIIVIIPLITIIFCIITFFTFDKEKEDNPMTFFVGIMLSLLGIYMYIAGLSHQT